MRPPWIVTAERPLRVLQVGAGGMGRAWLAALASRSDVEVVGLVELDQKTGREALAARQRDVPVSSNLADLAAKVSPDFVLDVTVPAAHHPVTTTAMELGLPVLGEKPLAETLAEASELVRIAERTGQLFVVSQSRRYDQGLFALRDAIPQIGTPGIVTTEFYKAPHFGGFREQMAHVLLLDMAVHSFDSARFLLGSDPVSVSCQEYNPSWSWYAGAAAATATFEMSDGARYLYHGSWCSPGAETSWNGTWRVSGEFGTARWDGERLPDVAVGDGASKPAEPGRQVPGDGIDGSLADFITALRTGAVPMGEVHDNLYSLAMVHAAIESSKRSAPVRIEDVLVAAGART